MLTRRLNYAINTMTTNTHIAYSSLTIWFIEVAQLLNAIEFSIQSSKCKIPQRKLGVKLFILSNCHVKMRYRMPWIETDNIFWRKYFIKKIFNVQRMLRLLLTVSCCVDCFCRSSLCHGTRNLDLVRLHATFVLKTSLKLILSTGCF